MLLVHQDDLGTVSYRRALDQGFLLPLTRATGTPLDIPHSPGLRALALSPDVPPHSTVTGLAGLWVRHGGVLADTVDVVRHRGSHRLSARPVSASRIAVHASGTGGLGDEQIGPITVAAPARCMVDALRWAPLGDALVAVWCGLRDGAAKDREISKELLATAPDRSRRRAASAWQAIQELRAETSPVSRARLAA